LKKHKNGVRARKSVNLQTPGLRKNPYRKDVQKKKVAKEMGRGGANPKNLGAVLNGKGTGKWSSG